MFNKIAWKLDHANGFIIDLESSNLCLEERSEGKKTERKTETELQRGHRLS